MKTMWTRERYIPLPELTGVHFQPAAERGNGYLRLAREDKPASRESLFSYAPRMVRETNAADSSFLSATFDEDAFFFERSQQAAFERLRDAIISTMHRTGDRG